MDLFEAIEHKLSIRLTRRGRLFIGWTLFAMFIALWAVATELGTPEACKVPFEEMSLWCKDFITQ